MKKTIILIFSTGIFLIALSGLSWCEELTGREIMDKVFYIEDGEDSYRKIDMALIDKNGVERDRQLEIISKDYGELRKTYLEFTEPPDIEHTRFLSIENTGKDDTQYLYLPALGRSRRIVSNQKKLRFVNTDYTYEDMQRRRPDKDEHRLLRQETFGEFYCYVIESVPKEGTSQYSKRVVWVDKASFFIVKADFYDKKEKLIKQFTVEKLSEVQGIWTAMKTVMKDIMDNHSTVMTVVDVKYNQNIEDGTFQLHYLEGK